MGKTTNEEARDSQEGNYGDEKSERKEVSERRNYGRVELDRREEGWRGRIS
jgi:hypothetical protein